VETANLFPRFSLMGGIGQQARAPGDLVSTDSTRFQIGPSFRWPIFDAGRIRAQIRTADARADQAAARYTRAVLAALSDSETAVNLYYAALAALSENDAARNASSEALDLARQRYRAGEDDLLALLDAQSRYTAADRALIEARQQSVTAYVALVKALAADAPLPDRPRGVTTSSRPPRPQP
jgi:outer membrane protein TolC